MRITTALILVTLFLAVQSCDAEPVDLDDIDLPKGFVIEEYADVPNARSLALGENGVVFVSNRRASSVYAIVPHSDANSQVIEIIKGLTTPNGIAFYNGDLYVAEIERILRYKDVGTDSFSKGRLNNYGYITLWISISRENCIQL